MTTAAVHTTGFLEGPKLRLLPIRGRAASKSSVARRSALRLLGSPSTPVRPTGPEQSILLAGGNRSVRSSVLDDLSKSMPASTSFEQAEATWEVLARAPQSKMVILSGDLEDISAAGLMQMLAHRHPSLPVVSIAAQNDPLDARP